MELRKLIIDSILNEGCQTELLIFLLPHWHHLPLPAAFQSELNGLLQFACQNHIYMTIWNVLISYEVSSSKIILVLTSHILTSKLVIDSMQRRELYIIIVRPVSCGSYWLMASSWPRGATKWIICPGLQIVNNVI